MADSAFSALAPRSVASASLADTYAYILIIACLYSKNIACADQYFSSFQKQLVLFCKLFGRF